MKKRLFSFFLIFSFLVYTALLLPSSATAQTEWTGVCISDGFTTGTGDVVTIQGAQCLIANVLMVAIRFIGLAGFVMLIVGSFTYLLSGGNSKGTENAKNTMTFAIVGLVVALSAVIILNLLAAFTGVSLIRQFTIPNSDVPAQPRGGAAGVN